VVVFNKAGEYQSEYSWSEIQNATEMVVWEAGKKIFLLIGSKIFELGLRS